MGIIVVDAASGEQGGAEAVKAAAQLSLQRKHQLVLVGDEATISDTLAANAYDAELIQVVHTPDTLNTQLDARTALERAPNCSLATGMKLVADSPGAAFVSAGHTGAIILLAHRHLKASPGVSRSALAAVYPTLRHRGETKDPFALLLDVGATIRCGSVDLVHFAAMGAAYAKRVSVNDRPRVGLLSNGSRPSSALPSIAEAHNLLQNAQPGFEYIGLLRGDQVTLGEADVIVTDGFTGDVLVRALEGVAHSASTLLQKANERFSWRMGLTMLSKGLQRLQQLTDWENYGGAPLLGFERCIILTQANSHQRAFMNAIRLATKIQREAVIEEIGGALRVINAQL